MKKIKIIQISLSIILILTLPIIAKGETMFSKQPIISVKISAYLCKFDLRINDVSVASNNQNFPTEVTIPINHWIQNGNNNIYLIQDISEQESMEGSSCEVTLLVKENGTDKSTAKSITNLKLIEGVNDSSGESRLDSNTLRTTEKGNVISNKASFKAEQDSLVLERVFSLPVNLPKWKWFSSGTIIDNKETRTSLYAEYEKMHKALKNKRLTYIGQVFNERLIELGAAFYKTPQEMASLSGFQASAIDPELELAPLDPNIKVEIMGNGKLIKLVRWNGKAQIGFSYIDKSAFVLYDLIYRKSGNQWILTR